MLKAIALTLAALAVFTAGPSASLATEAAAEISAEQIVAKHIAARGGERAMRAITTVVYDKGAYREPGFELPGTAVMMLKRPYFKLVGHPLRKPDFMEGYDGAAWEWFADPGVTVRTTGAASEAIRHYADVDGPFLDYRAKGSKLELVGTTGIGGKPAHQVRLTMMDGFATDYFFDANSFLMVASRHSAKVHAYGDKVTSETRFEDFRPVAGVLFPFRSREVEIATGKELNAMTWGSIEANADLPDAWFSPPAYQRTPLQAFMDQLFIQRDDASAVLWTYRQFRRTHPGVDTREAAQIMGFQILKNGQKETTITLLERNAADHPDSADSAFGLGRAYAGAGRTAEARAAFEKALKLDPNHARAKKGLDGLSAA